MSDAPNFLTALLSLVGKQVTIYSPRGLGFGFVPLEVKLFAVRVKPWAQYKHGLVLEYLERGGSATPRAFVLTSCVQTVVAKGWDLPKPEHWLKPSDEPSVAGVTVSVSRHSSCSPEWRRDFERDVLSKLVPGTYVDLLGYDGHSGTIKAEVAS